MMEVLSDATCTSGSVVDGMPCDIYQRWHGKSALIRCGMLIHLGTSIYESIVFTYYGRPWVFHMHHVIVVLTYGLAIFTDTNHVFAAWHGLTEWPNFNLCILKICLVLNRGRGGIGEILNGLSLYLGWIVFRMLSLPLLFYVYWDDALRYPSLTHWIEPQSLALRTLKWLISPGTIAIFGLSALWFVPIQRGIWKALTGKQSEMVDAKAKSMMAGVDDKSR
jgi:hypothetical protein